MWRVLDVARITNEERGKRTPYEQIAFQARRVVREKLDRLAAGYGMNRAEVLRLLILQARIPGASAANVEVAYDADAETPQQTRAVGDMLLRGREKE
jgi:hypothetical protein